MDTATTTGGKLPKYIDKIIKLIKDKIRDLDENTLAGAGSGASFNTGNSMAYMGKNPFKKKRSLDEQEEELSKDVQTIGKILPKVNNKIEWEELLNVLIDKEIPSLSLSAKKTFLMNQIKTLVK